MTGSASTPGDFVAAQLRALVFDVFDEHDAARRAQAIPRVFAADADFIDPAGQHHGHSGIEAAVVALQARLVGYRFQLTSEPQVVECVGRATWAFGPPEEPARVTGMDVVWVRDGRVSLLVTFLDPPAVDSGAAEKGEAA